MAPTGQPAKVAALNALVTVLESIKMGNTYYTEVRRVAKFEPNVLGASADRAVYVLLSGSDFENESLRTLSQWQDTLQVRVYLVLKTNTDIVDELLRFERDVLTALIADLMSSSGRLGGNALREWVTSANYVIANERGSESYVDLAVRIDLRTAREDLNAPA